MGNKYSEFSDFEINKLVAEQIFKNTRYTIISENNKDVKLLFKDQIMDTLTYANSYAYASAFKLMIENKISLRYISLNGKWEAIGGIYSDRLTGKSINTTSVYENPCRAIAECYLLIKDAENGQKL